MADWIEYMTSNSHSTLADLRRHNGHADPFPVKFLAIGNETWGCGGNMSPDYYADVYKRFATFIHAAGPQPVRIASGGLEADVHWTDVMMSQAHQMMDGYSLHYYTLPTGVWEHKGPALAFPEADWISTFKRTMHIEELINMHAAVMDHSDPEHKVGLYVDEWGTWYDPAPGSNPAFLVQQNTLRDALLAGVNFNIFHRHADRVRMTNIAQLINVLQAMILTDGPRMLRTPTYYAYLMYVPFHDATFLPIDLTTPNYTVGETSIPALSTTAARGADGKTYVALINLDPHRSASVSAHLAGLTARHVSGQILTAAAMDAHNTFEAPNSLVPAPFNGASISRDRLNVNLPAKSLVVLAID
ncbi:MAG: alpha-L-arabinofuranosidase C-terminal domain-containing protein, partial [Pseudomonadota bacterium]